MHWLPMDMAPRNGWPFIYLRRIEVWAHSRRQRYEYEIGQLERAESGPDSAGYWRNASRSVPDANVEMSRGWWCHSLPVNPDGTIKLPPDFETAPLPGMEKAAA